MDISFEPYGAGDGQARLRLPLQMRATDISDAAFFRALDVSIAATGYGTQDGEADLTWPPPQLLASATGNMGLLRLEPTQLVAVASTLVPTIAVAMLSLPSTAMHAEGITIGHGEGDLRSPTRLLTFGFEGGGAFLRMPLQITALPEFSVRNYVLMEAEVAMLSLVEEGRIAALESLELSSQPDTQQVMVRQALLALGASGGTLLDSLDAIRETLAFADVAGIVWNLVHEQVLELGGTAAASTGVLLQAAEVLALSAGYGNALEALNVVLAALHLGSAAAYVWPTEVLESIELAGGGVGGLLALNRQTEHLALSGTAVGAAGFTLLADESLALGVEGATTAELINKITEGLELLVRISLPDGEYFAWVCNTESRAFTSYRNFPFNSFCELGGHYYGATDEGIYLLEGEDDDGAPIDARIRAGLMDMGTGKMKRQEALYLGYRADGQLLLKVVTTNDDGAKAEGWYALAPQPAQTMREGRIKIGRGLKSVYWGFEIANIDGADFELDSLSWLPMVLDRRI